MIFVFLFVHIILCVIIYILMRLSILKAERMIMPLVCLVPVWGILSMIFLEIRDRGKQEIHEEVEIEKLKINDEIFKSILMEEDPLEERLVPLEEALLINNPSTRRALMMEIMYSNPSDYVKQLKDARSNDDTEVVHYAVTALVELQKEYDFKFQELDRELENNPDDDDVTDKYIKLLNQYLDSGIAAKNDMDIKLRTYSEMLGRKLKRTPERLTLWREKAKTDLKIREYEKALEEIQYIIKNWDRKEAGYLLLLQYYSELKDREGIDRVLEQIDRKNVHLTPRGRGRVSFWKKEEGVREA